MPFDWHKPCVEIIAMPASNDTSMSEQSSQTKGVKKLGTTIILPAAGFLLQASNDLQARGQTRGYLSEGG
jgi:hypothetical protein